MQNEAHLWRLPELDQTPCTWLQILPAPGKLLFILYEITLAVNPSQVYEPSSVLGNRDQVLKTFLWSTIKGLRLNLNSNAAAKTGSFAEEQKFWILHWCDLVLLLTCLDLSSAIIRNPARRELFLWKKSKCAFLQKDTEGIPAYTEAADDKWPLKKMMQHTVVLPGAQSSRLEVETSSFPALLIFSLFSNFGEQL